MYITIKDFRMINNKIYFPIRQGDILCSVYEKDGWNLVYDECNPKKFGFVPSNYIQLIKY